MVRFFQYEPKNITMKLAFFRAILTNLRMDGEDHQKKSGFKGKQAKWKFAHTVKSGVNQKVSQTPQDDDLPPFAS
jgi:hypothetical protein